MKKETRRVALVTGANRGIGFEIAKQLTSEEIIVLVGVRDRERGSEAVQRLTGQGLDAHCMTMDVTDPKTIQAGMGKIRDRFGRLDILVNNAGIMIDGETGILDLSTDLLHNTFQTNAYGPLMLSQACIPLMKKNRYGRIVNMSSTLGSMSDIMNPDSAHAEIRSPAYRLSKTLLNGLTVLLAREVKGENILVNSVCPGWVRTDMGGDQAPVSPAEAAATPVWLATLSDDGPTGGFFRERQLIPW